MEKEKKAEGEKKEVNGKEDGPITAVFKVEMHCEGCAQKVRRSVKGFKGIARSIYLLHSFLAFSPNWS